MVRLLRFRQYYSCWSYPRLLLICLIVILAFTDVGGLCIDIVVFFQSLIYWIILFALSALVLSVWGLSSLLSKYFVLFWFVWGVHCITMLVWWMLMISFIVDFIWGFCYFWCIVLQISHKHHFSGLLLVVVCF